MPKTDITITEITEFEPTRVDGVGKGANGFPILMLKGVERPNCVTCEGSGKVDGKECADCKGSGKKPMVGDTEKSLLEAAKESGVAESGLGSTPAKDCPTCKGDGIVRDGTHDGLPCPDCQATGNDGARPDADKLNVVNAPGASVTEGDARETLDKGADVDGFRPEPYVPDADETVQCPKCERMNDLDAAFCDQCGHELIGDDDVRVGAEKADGAFSAMNVVPDASAPGSPAWEAVDAMTATAAATALLNASELIRAFAEREAQEQQAGEGNALFDVGTALDALDGVVHALGIMAQLAFHEGQEAQKGEAVKAGRRLSSKAVSALAAARDHLNTVLGDDDPSQKTDEPASAADKFIESADKATKGRDVLEMDTDELKALVAETVAEAVVAAEAAKAEKATKVKKDQKDKGDDSSKEDDAMSEDDDEDDDAEKAEKSEAEIEADRVAEEARQELKAAKKAQKQAAKQAEMTKAIEDALAKVAGENDVLKATVEALTTDLAAVKKMAAPSDIVRTRPQDALVKSAERDALELEVARFENLVKSTQEQDLRRGYNEHLSLLRTKIAGL